MRENVVQARPGQTKKPSYVLRACVRIAHRLKEFAFARRQFVSSLWPEAKCLSSGVAAERVVLQPFPGKSVLRTHKRYLKEQVYLDAQGARVLDRVIYIPRTNTLLKDAPRRIVADNVTSVNNLHGSISELRSTNHKRIAGFSAVFRQNSLGYAHTLLDNLSRILLLCKVCEKHSIDELDLLCGKPTLEPEFQLAEAVFSGSIRFRPLNCDATYFIDSLLFPDLVCKNLMVPQWVKSDLRGALGYGAPGPRRKIIVSRGDANRRRLLNENELVDALEPYGFEKVIPSNMDFVTQARLFSAAQVVVGVHGAGLANTAFCHDHFLLELFPNPETQPAFWLLGSNSGVRYQHLIGNGTDRHADFSIAPDQVVSVLRQNRVL